MSDSSIYFFTKCNNCLIFWFISLNELFRKGDYVVMWEWKARSKEKYQFHDMQQSTEIIHESVYEFTTHKKGIVSSRRNSTAIGWKRRKVMLKILQSLTTKKRSTNALLNVVYRIGQRPLSFYSNHLFIYWSFVCCISCYYTFLFVLKDHYLFKVIISSCIDLLFSVFHVIKRMCSSSYLNVTLVAVKFFSYES